RGQIRLDGCDDRRDEAGFGLAGGGGRDLRKRLARAQLFVQLLRRDPQVGGGGAEEPVVAFARAVDARVARVTCMLGGGGRAQRDRGAAGEDRREGREEGEAGSQ